MAITGSRQIGGLGGKNNGPDPFGGLQGSDRDAYAAMLNILKTYGLESLAPTVLGYVKNGYSSDTISVLLPETDAYKKRFAGNAARTKAGLPALTPAEYLSLEGSYREIMSTNGLPPGFYDDPSDFTNFIANDLSPNEVSDRVTAASELYHSSDEASRNYFEQFYTRGDMIAYLLDPKRADAVTAQQQVRAAQAAAAGDRAGLSLSQAQAEDISTLGLTAEQQAAGINQAANSARSVGALGDIYGDSFTVDDALGEVFQSSGTAANKRRKLNSQERASFGGSANTSTEALSKRDAGRL